MWKVSVFNKKGIVDSRAAAVKRQIEEAGFIIDDVKCADIFFIEGKVTKAEAEKIARGLLYDPVTQEFLVTEPGMMHEDSWAIEVSYKPAVMDVVALSTEKAISDMGIFAKVRTGQKYVLYGKLNEKSVSEIAKILSNALVQDAVCYDKKEPATKQKTEEFTAEGIVSKVDVINANEKQLVEISRKNILSLSLDEMKTIKEYFRKLKRNPTDAELETIAQTWSEHCKHKVFNGLIEFENDGKRELIDNLFKNTIKKATEELKPKKKWLVSVFEDNAGIIDFNGDYRVAFKVETHNKPSALDPYGGANTGIGGVIRDILGVGLGAKPIFNTDIFCFAPPDYNGKLPEKILHPKRVMRGVVSGVRDYGNRMGIPTINGAVVFHESYLGIPLVFCGTAGIMPKGFEFKRLKAHDLIVLIGGKTGRDGIHGATFSSGEVSKETPSSVVQIGNAIEEKRVLDVLMKARDKKLYTSITDCGGGGLSSSIGEMAKNTGCIVHLEKIPLKYEGLQPWEIWVSEAQERMILAVEPDKLNELLEICREEDVEATVIGEFTGEGLLEAFWEDKEVIKLDMKFLHDGAPRIKRRAEWKPGVNEKEFRQPADLFKVLKQILSNPNIASKEWIIRQYDHEVQGCSVIKPLVGFMNDGPGDASVVKPLYSSDFGVAVSNGINPRYYANPYNMAASAVDEALRNIVSVGGDFEKIALLDNFCFGNPDKPDRIGPLVLMARACYDAAVAYETPFISGKDSFYNEFKLQEESIPVLPTLLISAISVIGDVNKTITMDFKKAGDKIYILGETFNELGGSAYCNVLGFESGNVPKVDFKKGKKLMESLSAAINKGLVAACHDCSEGGMAVALSEMAFSGGLGAAVCLKNVPCPGLRDDVILFSESNSRFIVEVKKEKEREFENAMKGNVLAEIGITTPDKKLEIFGVNGKTIISADIMELKERWQSQMF